MPISLYIHWPFCKSKCPYCDFNSHVRAQVDETAWKTALLKELETLGAKMPDHELVSIFFGGGTPSLMPPDIAHALIDAAISRWKPAADIEITLEANPTSVEAGKFKSFKEAGVNRVSLGVQALNAADLAFLGREHDVNEALTAVELAAATFERYSFDLIYARPNQTLADWEAELTRALTYARGHLSLYQLTIEENTAFHPAHKRGDFTLPPDESAAALYTLTDTLMREAGMPSYEISNYAAPGQESRHNLTYWTGNPYIGIGPGAHGRLEQNGRRIATNTLKSPERWLESVARCGHGLEQEIALSETEAREEMLMTGLRLTAGIPRNHAPFIPQERIASLIRLGLLEDDNRTIRPTLQGRLVLNTLTAELLS